MFRRDDPRFRRRLDQLSHNVESATGHAQENLYTFSQQYLNPCFVSIGSCFHTCTESCIPGGAEHRRRRQRAQSRGRPELNFDFYDDWEEDENDALLGWGNSSDQLNSLIAANSASQPRRERRMSYGTRGGDNRKGRKSASQLVDTDVNVIPGSNYLGFLERLPWNMGRKALRYQPSAADLQEQPRIERVNAQEQEPLLEGSEEDFATPSRNSKHRRNRSLTETSKRSSDSLSSRGDLWPSDDEADAIPLDDEFADTLTRKSTGEESPSGKPRLRGSKNSSRVSVRTVSSKSVSSLYNQNASGSRRRTSTEEPATLSELRIEEDGITTVEEEEVVRRRQRAHRVAAQRGLSFGKTNKSSSNRAPSPQPEMTDIGSRSPSSSNGTSPFPLLDPPQGSQTPRSEMEFTLRQTPEKDEASAPLSRDVMTAEREPQEDEFTPAALPRFST